MTLGQVLPIVIPATLTIAGTTWAVLSWKRTGSRVSAELAVGQLDETGVLSVQFASGTSTIMSLPRTEPAKNQGGKKRKAAPSAEPTFQPVNVVFVRNRGRTGITVSRCTYLSDLDGAGFHFEPQPGASPYGDLLPKRLDPGQDAVLVHAYNPMKAFLNQVMFDHGVRTSSWAVTLTLGNGQELVVRPSMQLQIDKDALSTSALQCRLERHVLPLPAMYRKHPRFPRLRRRQR